MDANNRNLCIILPNMTNLALEYSQSYKSAYLHPDLEAIYKIEKVDIGTIKRLTVPVVPAEPAQVVMPTFNYWQSAHNQLEFEFDGEFRKQMQPLVLEEPIQVLNLSPQAEKILINHDKRLVKDLIALGSQELVFLRGMGQGHIDEMQHKLHLYLEKHDKNARQVDFASLIRILTGMFDRKKMYVLLEKFGLSDLISLTPAENVEVIRLPLDSRLKIAQEARQAIYSSHNIRLLGKLLTDIVDVFIKPWIRKRHGLVTRDELVERLQRISQMPDRAFAILNFLSDVFYDRQFILNRYLFQVTPDIYTSSGEVISFYHKFIQRALTYFPAYTNHYHLSEFVRFLQKEFAQEWNVISEEWIAKALSFSSHFRLRKGPTGELVVRLA